MSHTKLPSAQLCAEIGADTVIRLPVHMSPACAIRISTPPMNVALTWSNMSDICPHDVESNENGTAAALPAPRLVIPSVAPGARSCGTSSLPPEASMKEIAGVPSVHVEAELLMNKNTDTPIFRVSRLDATPALDRCSQ